MARYYLGIDQGTTLTTAVLTDENWNVVSKASVPHRNYYPEPGWVEQNPEEIYENCIAATKAALEKIPGAKAQDIFAMGLDHQGETCCAWDKTTGKPVYPAIVWQDRRTAYTAETINNKYGDEILQICGMRPDAYYSATKLKWIIDNVPEAKVCLENGNLLMGTLNTYIFWRLTGGECFMTDPSSASCMMLMDLKECKWSKRLLDIFGLPEECLPEIVDNSYEFGYTKPYIFLDAKVLIGGTTADSSAAIIGGGCFKEGILKTSYGTGNFMSLHTGDEIAKSEKDIFADCIWSKNGHSFYRLRGACYTAGAAVEWLKNGIGLIEKPQDTEWICKSVKDTNGVFFVPAFAGLATPFWDQYARGTMVGLTAAAEDKHVVRAVMESIAYQVTVCYRAMKEATRHKCIAMRADGGMVENDFLMQFQSDMLDLPIEIPMEKETAALGAACIAGITTGALESPQAMREKSKIKKIYEPNMSSDEREVKLYQWNRAVKRSMEWAER